MVLVDDAVDEKVVAVPVAMLVLAIAVAVLAVVEAVLVVAEAVLAVAVAVLVSVPDGPRHATSVANNPPSTHDLNVALSAAISAVPGGIISSATSASDLVAVAASAEYVDRSGLWLPAA